MEKIAESLRPLRTKIGEEGRIPLAAAQSGGELHSKGAAARAPRW